MDAILNIIDVRPRPAIKLGASPKYKYETKIEIIKKITAIAKKTIECITPSDILCVL